jgi:hypothetical protein
VEYKPPHSPSSLTFPTPLSGQETDYFRIAVRKEINKHRTVETFLIPDKGLYQVTDSSVEHFEKRKLGKELIQMKELG